MTFQVGQLVRCIDQGHSGKLTNGNVYTVAHRRVDSDGDEFIHVVGVVREFFAHRFEALTADGAPISVPKPKLILNEKAKRAQPAPSQTGIPEGSVVYTHPEYIEQPALVASSPLWITLRNKLPYKYHDYVYRSLKMAFGSPTIANLQPNKTSLIDAFTWSSAPREDLWHNVYDAVQYGNFSGLNSYFNHYGL